MRQQDDCGKCGALKIRAADGQLRCVPCQSEWVRQYYHRRKERRERQRGSYLKRTYDTTLAWLEKLLAKQRGVCAICGTAWQRCRKSNGRYSDGTFLQYLNIDHDHKTGNIRGLLCAPCNIAIGKLDDSIDNCRRAAAYLRRAREA